MTRVYLLDDHAMLRDGLKATLEGAGHEVVGESGDPTQALHDIERLVPAVAIVDLSLGPRSGFELLEELQRRRSAVRCIVLTMSAQASSLRESFRLGAAGYVLKGSRSAELLNAIDTVLAHRTYIGEGAQELAAQAIVHSERQSAGTLSARERQVVAMVVDGMSSAKIGEALNLSAKTVETYRSRLMAKLGVSDLPALVRWAIREGIIDVDRP